MVKLITHSKFLILIFKGRRLQKLVTIIIILNSILFVGVNADYTVCDSGNINFTGSGVIEICNGGTMTGNIVGVDDFTGSFINFNMGYWGNNYDYSDDISIEENLSFGYFDENKKTVIIKLNPQNDNTIIGYWGNNYDFINPEIDIGNSYPLGFFDNTKSSYINKINPNFDTPVGFLGDYILPVSKKRNRFLVIEIPQVTYREFLKEKFNGGSYQSSYNLFIEKYLDFIIDGSNIENKIIDETIKNRINLYIENSDFNNKLEKLKIYYRKIDNAFKKAKNREEKIYILKYYLK